MQSEISTECIIKKIVEEIKRDLSINTNLEVCKALKKVGRFALKQFEWDVPDWANEYKELFKE